MAGPLSVWSGHLGMGLGASRMPASCAAAALTLLLPWGLFLALLGRRAARLRLPRNRLPGLLGSLSSSLPYLPSRWLVDRPGVCASCRVVVPNRVTNLSIEGGYVAA